MNLRTQGPPGDMNMLRRVIAEQMKKRGGTAAPGQQSVTLGGYENPTQRDQLVRQRMGQAGLSSGVIDGEMNHQRDQYAGKRLGQFGRVASLLGGDFQQAFDQRDQSDPAAAYRGLSGLFAQQSQAQGIADPRELLKRLLMQLQGGNRPNMAV